MPRWHLLTRGWSKFVNQKKLCASDLVLFIKHNSGELFVGIRQARSIVSGGVGRWKMEDGRGKGREKEGRGKGTSRAVALADRHSPFAGATPSPSPATLSPVPDSTIC
ncbi:hypothetical protein AAC387_Pa04g0421 [Persea americana]